MLHFAGHHTFTDETGSLISLDGGPLRPSDLSYARQRRAYGATRPLVFLNGCRTAAEIPGFTQMTGWASEFMGAGASAFIGSLWPVRSAAAQVFAAEFYRALVGSGETPGETLGAASLRARKAIAADEYYSSGFPICELAAAQRDVRSPGFRLHCVTSFRPARARLPRRAAGRCSDASGRRPGGAVAGRTSAGRRRAGRG